MNEGGFDNKKQSDAHSLRKKVDDLIEELSGELESAKAAPDLLKDKDKKRRRPLLNLNKKAKALIVVFVILLVSSFMFFNVNKIRGTAIAIPSEKIIINAGASGVLKDLSCREGDKLEKRTQICRIYNEELETQLKLAENEVESVNQRLAQLKERADWLGALAADAAQKKSSAKEEPSTLSYNYALHEYNIKKEELNSLNIKINYLKSTIEQLNIISPISGVVASKIEDKVGSFIKEGEEICRIANTNDMLLQLPVKEEEISKIVPGQKALIQFSVCPQRKITGFVLKTGYNAWNEEGRNWPISHLVNVMVKPRELPPGVKIGTTAKVTIYLSEMRY